MKQTVKITIFRIIQLCVAVDLILIWFLIYYHNETTPELYSNVATYTGAQFWILVCTSGVVVFIIYTCQHFIHQEKQKSL